MLIRLKLMFLLLGMLSMHAQQTVLLRTFMRNFSANFLYLE